LELAGTLIQSSSEVKNFELTKDQITSYSAAILSVETVHESFDYTSEQNTLTLTVKAAVDTEETRKQLVAIASDRILQQQIDERLKMLQQLEEAIKRTNTQLARATPEQAGKLREERTFVFTVLADLEKGHRVAKK
jgi:acyl-CoA reductase-like NAD-dependent aldehyde dehydrogenase